MKTPGFYLFSVLVFWGWQHQLLWLAVGLGIILESAAYLNFKFSLSHKDFNKFVDISIIVLAGAVVTSLTQDAQQAIFTLLKWFPVILFPIMAAQQFSIQGAIDVRAFLIMIRKQRAKQMRFTRSIDFSLVYAFSCLIAAGAVKTGNHVYFTGVALFFLWNLWIMRPKRYTAFIWIICMAAIIFTGVTGSHSIQLARIKIRHWMIQYWSDYYQVNPFKRHTALNDITTLKLSNTILFRVVFDEVPTGGKMLLHQASYSTFRKSRWFAMTPFQEIFPGRDKTSWQINPSSHNTRQMTAYFRPVRGKAVLGLPAGTISIAQMKTDKCEKNSLQCVRIQGTPPFIKSVITYHPEISYDAPPMEKDLAVPETEIPAIDHVINRLNIKKSRDPDILTGIKHYFENQFQYSLTLQGKGDSKTALSHFLNQTKSGHCELFATAAVLILRHMGIPARYATGFMAHEYSRMGQQIIVRQKDAHAWAKVYINGKWQNFDPTPPDYLNIDNRNVTASPVKDFFSFLRFQMSRLRHETGKELMNQYGLWLVLPLGIILVFRLKKTGDIKKVPAATGHAKKQKKSPSAPSFLWIETALTQKGFPRNTHETYSSWIERIQDQFDTHAALSSLKKLLQLHHQDRFSRSGLTGSHQQELADGIHRFLKEHL